MGTGKEGELQEAKVAEAGNEEKYNEEEREGTPGSQTGLVSVAESGNPGKLESEKEDIGAKPPIGKNVGDSVKELNGDDPVDPRPPPVVRDGRRYLSIQR